VRSGDHVLVFQLDPRSGEYENITANKLKTVLAGFCIAARNQKGISISAVLQF
jgi:hypothetical protein